MNNTSEADIKTYWQEQAVNDVPENAVTHPDFWLQWLEIEFINRYVKGSQRVHDVGCGNGYKTRRNTRNPLLQSDLRWMNTAINYS
ncbi:MAG: hypothetical protein GY855_14250 [candidate division Zixibacteria bacterium]|nr:hypothetical protein [candidate division Zixibacteria bacterium]